MLNSLFLQCGCLLLVMLAIVINRAAWGDPRLPLLLLGVLGVSLLVGLYVLVSNVYLAYQHAWAITTLTMINLALACVPILLLGAVIVQSQGVPAIHDITTDTNNPPLFDYATKARHVAHNSTRYDDKNSVLQKQAYNSIQPLFFTASPTVTMAAIKQVIKAEAWQLHGVDEMAGVIEAYDVTALFGFVDDIVIRVSAHKKGSKVDIRSASRIGVSDLGANAKRIQRFSVALANTIDGR
ncbi:MAG: hypothetical protein ACI9D5_002308 [Candidatus Endobugula sp.]|jgi:uncharacterized protein (DUF1499 family)